LNETNTSGASLSVRIALIAVARFITNTGYRMIYPFLPVIARGVGVDLQAIALAITARSSLGLAGPLLGSVGDRYGRKAAMLGGIGLLSVAMLIVGLWPTFPTLVVSLLLVGIVKIILDSSIQAYIGDHVSYARRGQAIAITELGWSTAFLFGVPVAGWLIARAGWAAPFPLLALLGVVMFLLLWRAIPADAPHADSRPSLAAGVRLVLAHRPALAGLIVALLVGGANELVNIVFGAWLEVSFGLQVAALGLASAVIGVAELAGEGTVAAFTDRIGLRRAVALGIVLSALSALALPLLDDTLPGALAGLFFFYLTFEFTYVSFLPLMTELVPGARATLMAGNYAAVSVGRMVGALAGPLLFEIGLLANGITAVVAEVVALAVLLAFVRTGER